MQFSPTCDLSHVSPDSLKDNLWSHQAAEIKKKKKLKNRYNYVEM